MKWTCCSLTLPNTSFSPGCLLLLCGLDEYFLIKSNQLLTKPEESWKVPCWGEVAATFRKLQTDDGDFPHQHLMQKLAQAVSFQVHISRNAVTTPVCWGRSSGSSDWPDAWARCERGPPSVGANRRPCSACFTVRCCRCSTVISFSFFLVLLFVFNQWGNGMGAKQVNDFACDEHHAALGLQRLWGL